MDGGWTVMDETFMLFFQAFTKRLQQFGLSCTTNFYKVLNIASSLSPAYTHEWVFFVLVALFLC